MAAEIRSSSWENDAGMILKRAFELSHIRKMSRRRAAGRCVMASRTFETFSAAMTLGSSEIVPRTGLPLREVPSFVFASST